MEISICKKRLNTKDTKDTKDFRLKKVRSL